MTVTIGLTNGEVIRYEGISQINAYCDKAYVEMYRQAPLMGWPRSEWVMEVARVVVG